MIWNTKTVEKNILQLVNEKNLLTGVLLCEEYAHLKEEIERMGGKCVDQNSSEISLVVACPCAQEKFDSYMEIAKKHQAAVLVAEGNAGWTPLVLAALSGDSTYHTLYQECHCPTFNEKSMQQYFEERGFQLLKKADVEQEYEVDRPNAFMQKGSQLYKTIHGISKRLVDASQVVSFVRVYQPVETERQPQQEPCFLSVIIRTQGNRIQALREAFLCLTAQDDTDFEVLLVGHKVPEEHQADLQQLLDELPPMMKQRLRYFPLNTGGRADPINFAAHKANGLYVSVFDDDDILMANWVSSFRKAYDRAPGAILHSYAVGQDWEFVSPRNKAGLRATAAFDNRFCTDFLWTKQFHTNYCPLMSLAFPTYLWKEMGQCLDNKLEVTEDWDFLMRMSSFCGVENEAEVTAIYRLWKNAENSYTKHDEDYWKKQYERITNRNKSLLVLLPEGGSEQLREAHQFELDKEYLMDLNQSAKGVASTKARVMDEKLYCDDGNSWCEENSFTQKQPVHTGKFCILYEHLDTHQKERQLRWDPASYSGLVIKDLAANVTSATGEKYTFTKADICTNGVAYNEDYIFLKDDPQIYFTMPRDFVPEKFMVTGVAETSFPIDEVIESIQTVQYTNKNPLKAAIKLLLQKNLLEKF